eukprot:3795785-Amphidinium_carterae.1
MEKLPERFLTASRSQSPLLFFSQGVVWLHTMGIYFIRVLHNVPLDVLVDDTHPGLFARWTMLSFSASAEWMTVCMVVEDTGSQ